MALLEDRLCKVALPVREVVVMLGMAWMTAATISGVSFLVKESVPLCHLAAGDEVDALEGGGDLLVPLPMEQEVGPMVAPCREVLRVVGLLEGLVEDPPRVGC